MSDEKQRAAMAAHLCELAAVSLREGKSEHASAERSIITSAKWALDPDCAVNNYREGLRSAGHIPEQIDAAVAAIERGEHPPDSLPARVLKEREDASDYGEENTVGGKEDAYDNVLEMLGVKP